MDTAEAREWAMCLHEAGHAIVALERKLIISEVVCDEDNHYCKVSLPPHLDAALDQAFSAAKAETITPGEFYLKALSANFDRLVTLMGGIAGESLVAGRPIYSTRAASDDIPAFFGFLGCISKHSSAQVYDPLWKSAFEQAQDAAWSIVRTRRYDVEKLAAALAKKPRLSASEVTRIIEKS